jgi:integrase
MSKHGLRNLKKETCSHNGQATLLLRTLNGREVEAFSRLFEFAQRYAPRTTKRYLEVVGRFLDYLFEAGVFEDTRLTTRRLNAIINGYPVLLRDGTELTARRVLQHATQNSENHWLAVTATALGWTPIKVGSFSNTLAAVNHFLPLSESLAREKYEHASLLGVEHNSRPDGLIKALQGKVQLTSMKVHRMRLNSMTGSVAKYAEKGIWHPRNMRVSGTSVQEDVENKAFSPEHLNPLIEAATSWCDKALWLLLAASGIRTSEARNMLLEDVLPNKQKVNVIDPSVRRFTPARDVFERPRFKGRAIAATYLFAPLRQKFFYSRTAP